MKEILAEIYVRHKDALTLNGEAWANFEIIMMSRFNTMGFQQTLSAWNWFLEGWTLARVQ